jgi:hypothetical protein
MLKSPSAYEQLEDCFEQLKTAYSEIKDDNERLQSYADILKAILEFRRIDYPSFDDSEELKF